MNTQETENLAAVLLDERQDRDDPWQRLAAGRITPERVAALRGSHESPEDIARKLELLGPASEERSEDLLKILLERYFSAPEPGATGSSSGDSSTDGLPSREEERSDRVLSLPEAAKRGKGRWWSMAAASAFGLAAAAVLAWVVRPPNVPPELVAVQDSGLVFEDGDQGDMRGGNEAGGATSDDGCNVHYRPEQSLHIRIPASPPQFAVLATRDDGYERWIRPSSKIEGQNLVIEHSLSGLGLTPGRWALTLYLLPAEHDYDPPALRELEPGADPGVTVMRAIICIAE